MQYDFVVKVYVVIEFFDAGTRHGIHFSVVLGAVDEVAAFNEIRSDEPGKHWKV